MITPAGKVRHQVNQGPFYNESVWNEILQKFAVTKQTLEEPPVVPGVMQQTMNESNSPALSGNPPQGADMGAGTEGRYSGETIADPAREQQPVDPGLAQIGLAPKGQDQPVAAPETNHAREIKKHLDVAVRGVEGVEILLVPEKEGGYKVGLRRQTDDQGQPAYEMVDPKQWKKGTSPIHDKIDQVMSQFGFVYIGDSPDNFTLYKSQRDVAEESQIKVQKGGKK